MNPNENNSWNEFQDDITNNIDKEWEDFNNDLFKDSEKALEDIRARAEYDEVSRHVIERLRLSDLPGRVIDGHPETEENLLREYARLYVERNGIELLGKSGEMDKYHEVQIAVNCIMEYYKVRELQALIVNEIALCKYLLQKSNGHMLMSTLVSHEKKRIQAELMVHHGMNDSNPWYVFFSQEVDTESIDVYGEEDRAYLYRAEESLEEHKNYYLKRDRLLKSAKALMGIDEYEEDLSSVIQVTGNLIELHLIASEPMLNDQDKTNRNEQLWEYGRINGFDNKVLAKIISLFEAEY